jgi:hypothetical protein
MMKYPKASSSYGPTKNEIEVIKPAWSKPAKEQPDEKIPVELLTRLATGEKKHIDKKEMKKLTNKNY